MSHTGGNPKFLCVTHKLTLLQLPLLSRTLVQVLPTHTIEVLNSLVCHSLTTQGQVDIRPLKHPAIIVKEGFTNMDSYIAFTTAFFPSTYLRVNWGNNTITTQLIGNMELFGLTKDVLLWKAFEQFLSEPCREMTFRIMASNQTQSYLVKTLPHVTLYVLEHIASAGKGWA